jgi:hypothetical protein
VSLPRATILPTFAAVVDSIGGRDEGCIDNASCDLAPSLQAHEFLGERF